MAESKIRLLVVEDSVYMQMAIRTMVKVDPGIEIVGEAKNGRQAIELARALRPDIITMDVNMPDLDGIEATRQIMAETPAAIVMLSSMTEKGVAITLRALEAGAVDYIPKSMSAIDVDLATIATRLASKIRFWGSGARVFAGTGLAAIPLPPETDLMVIVGGSGSPLAAGSLLRGLDGPTCPVLVINDELQSDTTLSLIDNLQRDSGQPVREGSHRSTLAPGVVTVMPGGRQGLVQRQASGTMALDFRSAGESGRSQDILSSAVSSAVHPLVVILSGKTRALTGLAEAVSSGAARLWVQAPECCALPDLANEAMRLGVTFTTLTPQGAAQGAERAA